VSFVTVTYTFTNGTAADAGQMNTNFTDLIGGTSDGTKDFNISALTCAGIVTLNSDFIISSGSLASTLPIKTQRTYDIGSANIGLRILYLGMNSTHTIALQAPSSGASADYTLTLPATVGVAGKVLYETGSGTLGWKWGDGTTSAKSADYVVTDTDGIDIILMTRGASDRTITLPTAADNSGRKLTIKVVDDAAGKVIIDGENSETIDGAATYTLYTQYDSITIQCDGSNWLSIDKNLVVSGELRLDTGNGRGSSGIYIRRFMNTTASSGSTALAPFTYADSATAGMSITINIPGDYFFAYWDLTAAAGALDIGISRGDAGTANRILSTSASARIAAGSINTSGVPATCSTTVRCAVGDVIRAHTSENATGTTNYIQFIAKMVNRI
jgi:hypothetical protein